jgi:predicted dehydrogenase
VTEPAGKAATTRIGIIGCGNIFERYMSGLARFPNLKVIGCTDIDLARATAASETFGVTAFADTDSLLRSPDVDVVINITPPLAHAALTIKALAAGKHVYQEKPLAATLEEAGGILRAARASGRTLGCAPDTFLGSASQTARAAVDTGLIGEPIGAACFVTHTFAETWHPDPTLFFRPGAGPLLDMGPYSITHLVNCLGPVTEVSGATRIGVTPRQVTTPGRLVDSVTVEVATHASAVLRFASGVVGTVMMSFDVWCQELPFIEIYGTTGILRLPDPNSFDGDVQVRANTAAGWGIVQPVLPDFGRRGTDDQMLRGLGVADLAASLAGSPQRATADLGYHVLEVLASVEASSTQHSVIELQSTCSRPAPLTLPGWHALFGLPAAEDISAAAN